MYIAPRRFAFVLLLFYAAGAAAGSPPVPFEAEYEGSRFPLSAKAKIALARAGDFYKYTLRGTVRLGFFEVTRIYDCSVMQLGAGTLRPLEYVHRDRRKPGRNLHTRFDWSDATVRTTVGDGSMREIDGLPGVAWDVMSVQVRLRMDVPGAWPGDTFDYAVVHKGELTHHRAEIEGRDTLDAGAREVQAVRVRADGPKRSNRFWFAGGYDWLPVRITMSGVTLELASPPEDAARAAGDSAGQAPGC